MWWRRASLSPLRPDERFHLRNALLDVTAGWRFASRRRDHIAELRDLDRQAVHHEPKWRQRVVHRARDRSRSAEVAGFARALLPEHRMRRRRDMMDNLDGGNLVRGRDQIVNEALRQ